MFKIELAETPNKSPRRGETPIAIVNHITQGSYPGCLSWMKNPASGASANYLILKNGSIIQLVKESEAAWHCGIVNKPTWKFLNPKINPNRMTIGIEHEGISGDTFTDIQFEASLWLHRQILLRNPQIKIDRDHIIGHYQIDGVRKASCPGKGFPWDYLMNALKSGVRINTRGKEMFGKIIDGKSYAPVRELAETLGFKVEWDDARKIAIIK